MKRKIDLGKLPQGPGTGVMKRPMASVMDYKVVGRHVWAKLRRKGWQKVGIVPEERRTR